MNKFVHADYKTKEVLSYIDDLIINDDVESISDLTEKNRMELSAMLLKTEPLTELLNFLSETAHDERFRDNLVDFMFVPDFHENMARDFTYKVAGFALDYYEPMIESILNERLDDIAIF